MIVLFIYSPIRGVRVWDPPHPFEVRFVKLGEDIRQVPDKNVLDFLDHFFCNQESLGLVALLCHPHCEIQNRDLAVVVFVIFRFEYVCVEVDGAANV